MPKIKNVRLRDKVLDYCFRNPGKEYSIHDLLDACNKALADLDLPVEVPAFLFLR